MNKKNCKRRNYFKIHNQISDIGLLLLIIGIVSICAFFLPAKIWIVLLALLFIIVGFLLLGK